MSFDDIDLLVVGAGPSGCVVAERAATVLGWRCLVIDERPHVGGNCHDTRHPSGVLIHRYGPHYFRTHSDSLIGYLSRFTDWRDGNYVVRSLVNGRLYPFPINLTTLEWFFGRELTEDAAIALIEQVREDIDEPANSEEFVLSRVGRELYEAFYLGYTVKQWGRHPRDLDPSVCGRIPVRFNRDDRYTDAPYQVLPAQGYTAMFERMLAHPRIEVLLNTPYCELRDMIRPRRATVYTGQLDSYFDYRLGRLAWRSLEFEFHYFDRPRVQPCAQINYPNEHDYTRSVEIKWVTGQQHPGTVVSYEFPRDRGEPYYPVPAPDQRVLHGRYLELAERERTRNRVYFCGRLARYRYINTDEAMIAALELFETIRRDLAAV